MSKYFILYSNCIPVKGFSRSTICDLQLGNFEFIPNELYNILKYNISLTYNQIIKLYGSNNQKIIDEYFEFLIACKFGFWNSKLIPELTDLSLKWESPQLITNALIDIKNPIFFPFSKISYELDNFNCESLELRFYDKIKFTKLDKILMYFSSSTLRSINILLQYGKDIGNDKIVALAKKHPRLAHINISNAYQDKVLYLFKNSVKVIYMKRVIDSEMCCGVVKPDSFSVNINHFSESIKFNTCLNRKISIDSFGEIKNCPSMSKSFGNIRDTTLEKALKNISFKKYWNHTKSQVNVCKDCEFKHICTDCRVFTVDNGKYSKPVKCNYNPYTATWKN